MQSPTADDLGLALSVVLQSYLDAAGGVFDGLPGGARGYHVLSSAAHHAPPTQGALAQQLGIDRSVLTYLLDDLEAKKLIQRRPDPADRRARRIVLTRAGQATFARLGRRLCDAEQHALRGLPAEDQLAVRKLLWRAASACADTSDAATMCAAASAGRGETAVSGPAGSRAG